MPEPEDAIEWDIIALISSWNLYGLPVLLTIVAVAALIGSRFRRTSTIGQDSLLTVRRIGLIHCALAVHSLMVLMQELSALRTMGIPESHAGLISSVISTAINPVVAVGMLLRRSWGRRMAIGWYAFLSVLAIVVVVWRWYYQVAFDPATWPDSAASKIMPPLLLSVMLLPRIRRVFAKRNHAVPSSARATCPDETSGAAVVEPPVTWPLLSLMSLLLLILVCSNLGVDAADSAYRFFFESDLQ